MNLLYHVQRGCCVDLLLNHADCFMLVTLSSNDDAFTKQQEDAGDTEYSSRARNRRYAAQKSLARSIVYDDACC